MIYNITRKFFKIVNIFKRNVRIKGAFFSSPNLQTRNRLLLKKKVRKIVTL